MSRLAALLVAAVLAAGCGGEDEKRPTVVAGFYPLAWAVEEVAGEAYEVVNLTPAGAEPHDLELSPRDVETVRDADLVVYVGGGFQPALEDAVAEREAPSLDVRSSGVGDPHVWLDAPSFRVVVERIGRALDRERAAGALGRRIVALDLRFRQGLARCDRREIVTTHAAFGHLADEYGLRQVALSGSSPEAEPSPRELERLVDEVRATRATTIFTEPLVSDRVAQTVAREVGARVAVLDPVEGLSEERLASGDDYFSVMDENLSALREALGCR